MPWLDQPFHRLRAVFQPLLDLAAELGDFGGKLVAPAQRFAEPEGHGGRLAPRVFHPHGAALDPQHAPRRVAELEDVARAALDREVFVDGADEGPFRLDDHPIVGDIGDGPARGECGEPRSSASPDASIHRVMVDQRPRRPRRVTNPLASISTTASNCSRVSPR